MGNRFIAWARVSSKDQADEGWSLPEQERKLREAAARHGGEVDKLYVVTETASKHAERKTFQEMIRYARENAGKIDGLLVMKIDRAARNLKDWVALETLEEECGVRIISVTQPTENTPSGRMMRRTFLNFAAFFTEQLSDDVKASFKKRVESGLFVSQAPYGYANVRDAGGKRRLIAIHPAEAANVRLVFQMYAYENHTLDSLRDELNARGVRWTDAVPRWSRSTIHDLLTHRGYIGDVCHLGEWHAGTHEPLVDRTTFDRVQHLLGRHAYRAHQMLYAGSLITCGHCGRPITGERKHKNTRAGVRHYTYYRCAAYNAAGHPRVRLPEADIDGQILDAFDRSRISDPVVLQWWGEYLRDITAYEQKESQAERARVSGALLRVRQQKDSLLNMRLGGEIDAQTFAIKSGELRDRESRLSLEMEAEGRSQSEEADAVLRSFELSQTLREKWVGADHDAKRRFLEIVCLNLRLDGASLVVEMRKPFSVATEGLIPALSRDPRTPLEPLESVQQFVAGARALPLDILRMMLEFTSPGGGAICA